MRTLLPRLSRRRWLGALLAVAPVPAQMTGTYFVDPSSPGAFASLTDATNALFAYGVAGPVEILIVPGSYTDSVFMPPIAGTSATSTVTFRAVGGPGTVSLQGSSGDTFFLLGLSSAHLHHIVFDGIDFTGAPGHAISATTYVEDIEIRNCSFAAGHQSNAVGETRHAVIVAASTGYERGWRVHHNRITLSPHTTRTSYGIHVSNGGNWEVHHNVFDLGGGDYGIWFVGNNGTEDRIYDNLFVGALNAGLGSTLVAAIRSDLANFENRIAHNTFALSLPADGCCIVTGGFLSGGNPVQNHIIGNVFEVTGSGAAIVVEGAAAVPQPFEANGNIYHCSGPAIGRIGTGIGSTSYSGLAAWQAATAQDGSSLAADPLLINPFGSPPDLRPQPGSPVTGLASGSPAFVTDDFVGRLRDASPDAGAYESTSFALYGAGCRGTGFLFPLIDQSGTVALGSTNFRLELTRGRGNAPAVLLAGFSREQSVAGPLPLSLGGTCNLLAAPDATVFTVTTGAGRASVPFAIPASPSWSGTDVFFQWAIVDPQSSSTYGLAVTAGGVLQL